MKILPTNIKLLFKQHTLTQLKRDVMRRFQVWSRRERLRNNTVAQRHGLVRAGQKSHNLLNGRACIDRGKKIKVKSICLCCHLLVLALLLIDINDD